MSDSVMYVLEATVKPGARQDFDVLLKEAEAATADDASAMNYEFFADGDDFRFVERFQDSPSTLAHLAWFGENAAERFMALADIKGLSVFGAPSADLRGALDGMGARYFAPAGGFHR